jgi:uncharacterized protein
MRARGAPRVQWWLDPEARALPGVRDGMTKLHIAPNLSLPTDAVTQTFGILAKRGVGKTYTASVLAEEMLKAQLQVVVADPIGVWHGLRSSADGKKSGLPIYVFGGESKARDLPLEVAGGELTADVVVDQRVSVVLDLSLFRKGEQVRFMTDSSERLYHRNRTALHLFLDEADAFAPQKPPKGAERLLGAVEDLVRRGRARGIGVTLITQRSAVLNKDVLTQIEVLVALRTISPQDREAIDAWVKVHGTPDQREELMASLPALPVGTAWFWSPGWPTEAGIFERVAVRARDTFDSSRTPKSGERRIQPKAMAAVDLDALRTKMAAAIERQKADDPAELRKKLLERDKRIRELERKTPVETATRTIEVAVLKNGALKHLRHISELWVSAADRLLKAEIAARERADVIRAAASDLATAITPVRDELARITSAPSAVSSTAAASTAAAARPSGQRTANAVEGAAVRAGHTRQPVRPATADESRAYSGTERTTRGGSTGDRARLSHTDVQGRDAGSTPAPRSDGITSAQQRILDAAAFWDEIGVAVPSPEQLAVIAGIQHGTGHWRSQIGALRTRELMTGTTLTPEGRELAHATPIAEPRQLHEFVFSRLTSAQRRILEVLIDVYPQALDATDLAARVGMAFGSGHWRSQLGRLRTMALVTKSGPVAALPVLFLEAA